MEKNILVVSEYSRSALERILSCPQSKDHVFCTEVKDIQSAELMINWNAVDEVLVVGSLIGLALNAVVDYALLLGAPVRYWKKEVAH